ncbi:alpha/beta hydrolase [Mycobacterium adipatum]|jgi:pimeloyl-ACP methyl ester carboxylesterase|uniref:Alpha/beta hydrolase n=1 Tax=Mycobacterium adipatum TaxID=1682113 RepID=A0A172UQP5_9MYCO|nr:alpha/beta fold hydrolase [Mycobacterium adipatum]ANE81487.1 alpha/beta hydrolase [Mycobacterium adipatum]MBI5737636.1 alpha/beta fold hydrolase [Mycolicibacterium neoaurum]
MSYRELSFTSHGTRCSAWHFRASGDRSRPAVVMAHGFGGTKDSGLAPFAERFAEAGIDVLAFDYRGFGASDGEPRQTISLDRQLADYNSAVDTALALPNVDRMVLWGASMSGGNVLRVAAGRADIAAVVALTPMTSGLAAGWSALASTGVLTAARWTAIGLRSKVTVARGGPATLMPIVGRPGEPGALTLSGAYESYTAMAGPTWRNEIDSGVGMELGRMSTKAAARSLRCPVLVQIGDFDRFVPAGAVARTAELARAQVHRYACDHFDVWPGNEWFDKTVEDQLVFLRRVLQPS